MTLTVHAFIECRDGVYVATCLEMGLVATANTEDELPAIMEKLIIRQAKFALENNNPADLFRPAPPEVWERFRKCREQDETKESRYERPLPVLNWSHLNLRQVAYGAYC